MKGIVLIAPTYKYIQGQPLIFLAGPIQGAYEWQEQAIQILIRRGRLTKFWLREK